MTTMIATPTSTLTPARIVEVGMAFWPAKVLLSGIELGVFTALGPNSLTGAELQAVLRLHPRANPDFFDTLVALRFLDRDGEHRGNRALPRSEQPSVHGRFPGNGERPSVPILGRSD